MKKILLLGLSTFILNAYVPVTITGKATGDGEKVKKEALSDLSNQISVEVKSTYKQLSIALKDSFKNSKQKLIEVKSELPLKSVRFVYEDGQTMAVLTSSLALNVYKNELDRLKKEIISIESNIKNTKSNSIKYRLYKSLLENVEAFNKHKVVAIILNGENLPTINITETDIKTKLKELTKVVDSIVLAGELLSDGITEKEIYIYPIKTNSSDEITQFSRVLKQELSDNIQTVYKPNKAKYFIRGTYEILKDKIFVTIKVMDINNKVLKSNSAMLDKKAYSSINYQPKTISFDQSINNNFTKNEFKINLGIKGYYSSNGIDVTEGDSINLVLKTNKPMCYYIVGHTLKPTGKKYSYLLQLKDDEGREAFIDRVSGEDVNSNYTLGEMEVVRPFGRESLQVFGQTLLKGKCNIAIPKCEWKGDLCIITGKPSEVVQKTRALSFKKPKKALKAETMIDFTSFKKAKK
jgi:hypothetical protein